ncbi:hypothetical protein HDV00_011619 [Rhizophlyctis rosea]|nr:hypothetical protein HDV00_011619 [Rhizophlyctis rosea]
MPTVSDQDFDNHRNPDGRSIHHLSFTCANCKKQDDKSLLRCTNCEVMRYCNKQCQRAHWTQHHDLCCPTRQNGSGTVAAQHRELRRLDVEIEKDMGWTYPTAYKYLDVTPSDCPHWDDIDWSTPAAFARFMRKYNDHYISISLPLVKFLLHNHKTRDALVKCIKSTCNLFEMIGPTDKDRIHEYIPFLCLRLNQEGGCYNFVKWFATSGRTFDKATLQGRNILEMISADPLERIDLLPHTMDMVSLVAVFLLKLRMLLDKQDMEKEIQKQDVMTMQKSATPRITYRSSILAFKPDPYVEIRFLPLMEELVSLFNVIDRGNNHFWQILSSPEAHLAVSFPDDPLYEHGSLLQAQWTVQMCLDAWKETEGALEWAKKMAKESMGRNLRTMADRFGIPERAMFQEGPRVTVG